MSTSETSETLEPTDIDYRDGHFYWADLMTPDVAAAEPFYADLLSWTFNHLIEDDYTLALRGGQPVAGFKQHGVPGAPAHWLPHMTTHDLDAAAARVVELGGSVHVDPFQVGEAGRLAIVGDPSGSTFGMWQPDNHFGTKLMGVHGSPVWFELHSADIDASRAFFAELFGQHIEANPMGEHMTYYVVSPGDAGGWGMVQLMDDEVAAGGRSYWQTYQYVDDVDAVYDHSAQLGGTQSNPPHDLPGVGRFGHIADPQGASLSFMLPKPQA